MPQAARSDKHMPRHNRSGHGTQAGSGQGKHTRAVIAGGSGFIGRELTRLLLASGHEVTILSRTPRSNGQARLNHAVWDGASQGDWSRCVDGADAVVNLAGANIAGGRWTARYKELLLRSRIDSTRALTRAVIVARRKPSVVIQASAVGYYGNVVEPSDESAPRGEGFLARLTSDWEEAGSGIEAAGVRRCLVRSGLVLGAGGILARMLPAFRTFGGLVLGNGRRRAFPGSTWPTRYGRWSFWLKIRPPPARST